MSESLLNCVGSHHFKSYKSWKLQMKPTFPVILFRVEADQFFWKIHFGVCNHFEQSVLLLLSNPSKPTSYILWPYDNHEICTNCQLVQDFNRIYKKNNPWKYMQKGRARKIFNITNLYEKKTTLLPMFCSKMHQHPPPPPKKKKRAQDSLRSKVQPQPFSSSSSCCCCCCCGWLVDWLVVSMLAAELATSSAPNSRALASRRHHRLFPVWSVMIVEFGWLTSSHVSNFQMSSFYPTKY